MGKLLTAGPGADLTDKKTRIVAVAFPNDTTMPIARVQASDEYVALLARLAKQDKWEPEPLVNSSTTWQAKTNDFVLDPGPLLTPIKSKFWAE